MSDALKILWINPIGIADYDQPLADLLADVANDDTVVEAVSFASPPGLNNLEYRSYAALIVADTVKTARYAAQNGYDAVVIGCFYDPALEAAREISGDAIVTAPCQASVQIALNLSRRFSVIIGQEKWREEMTDRVKFYGGGDNLASMRSINITVPDLQKDTDHTASQIIDAGRKAVLEDGAEALILGCTCTFGLFEEVQEELGVPVIDPNYAAFKMAEFLAQQKRKFGWLPSRVGGSAAPPEAEMAVMNIYQSVPDFANKVTGKASS